ncbi:1-phosphofructokinase [Holzapfeliella sp. JNUCC72]
MKVYTITVNPSLDYVMALDSLDLGEVNRTTAATLFAGGKGINVSQVLTQLDVDNCALGFIGGSTGQELLQQLNQKKIKSDFTTILEKTRINVKVKADQETEINAGGPKISMQEQHTFKTKLTQLTEDDIVVMSGSLARGLPDDFYFQLIDLIKEQGSQFVLDTSGQSLLDCLDKKPLMVKPNHHELADIFETTFSTQEEIIEHGRKLQKMGAQNVIVSMAGDGAYLVTEDTVYYAKPLTGKVVNSVGAGDSMVAGFVGTYSQTQDAVAAFKMGVACGSATAFTEDIATEPQINQQLKHVDIIEI